jgi:quercetin dioxygenase-like cupin family protein
MDAKNYRWDEVPKEQVNEFFARQIVSGEQVMVARLDLKVGCVVPRHHHHNEQVSLVLTGSIRFRLGEDGERELTLGPGEVLVIPGGVPHEAEILEDFTGIDVFSPPREDWLSGSDAYLRK